MGFLRLLVQLFIFSGKFGSAAAEEQFLMCQSRHHLLTAFHFLAKHLYLSIFLSGAFLLLTNAFFKLNFLLSKLIFECFHAVYLVKDVVNELLIVVSGTIEHLNS